MTSQKIDGPKAIQEFLFMHSNQVASQEGLTELAEHLHGIGDTDGVGLVLGIIRNNNCTVEILHLMAVGKYLEAQRLADKQESRRLRDAGAKRAGNRKQMGR